MYCIVINFFVTLCPPHLHPLRPSCACPSLLPSPLAKTGQPPLRSDPPTTPLFARFLTLHPPRLRIHRLHPPTTSPSIPTCYPHAPPPTPNHQSPTFAPFVAEAPCGSPYCMQSIRSSALQSVPRNRSCVHVHHIRSFRGDALRETARQACNYFRDSNGHDRSWSRNQLDLTMYVAHVLSTK